MAINAFFLNERYEEITLRKGTEMGLNHETGYVVPLIPGAASGSEEWLGRLAQDYTVAAGYTEKVSIVTSQQT